MHNAHCTHLNISTRNYEPNNRSDWIYIYIVIKKGKKVERERRADSNEISKEGVASYMKRVVQKENYGDRDGAIIIVRVWSLLSMLRWENQTIPNLIFLNRFKSRH